MLSRRSFLRSAATAAASLSLGQQLRAQSQAASNLPNFVLILTDDLGFGDVGFNGSRIRTPNLDALAAAGTQLNQFYAGNPVCSPSRAALMTGRYPTRVGVPDLIAPTAVTGLSTTEVTLPQMLKQAGYVSACIGKWHLGSLPEYMPTNRGFDQFYGVPFSNDTWPLPLMSNLDVMEPNTDNNFLTQKYTAAAIEFIQANQNRPFFLYLAHNVPHIPVGASPAFQGRSPLGPYGDAVEEMDWSVGQVVKALSNAGILNQTLCIFTSDNGPWYQGSAGRLRGRKAETYEGGVREPFLAYMPGTVPAGGSPSGFGSLMDLFPTFASLANAPLPAAPLDGINIWPMLSGQADSLTRDALLYFDSWNIQCARLGNWKLHVARYNSFPWVAQPSVGRVNLPLPNPELYDIVNDPEESYDCASGHRRANPGPH